MAMPEPVDVIGYAQAADAYWQAGWRGILPLKRGHKFSPPKGFTGYTGMEPSYPDVLQWAEEYPSGNLCLRLPDGVIGIDVDAYGAKTGAEAFAEAEDRWGALPPAPRSTSRQDDTLSGIRLFRVPKGTLLEDAIVFAELGIGDIEVIQRHHRYVVCWPSIHPEGHAYRWCDDENWPTGIPNIDTLPPLPQEWLTKLRVTPKSLNLNGEHYNVRTALTAGDPSRCVSNRLSQAIKELNLPGQSRHDTTCRHVLALLRCGKNGDSGVLQALELLKEVFVAAVGVDGSRTPELARAEFDRMITNDNAARELAQPGINDWMKSIVVTIGTDVKPVSGSTSADQEISFEDIFDAENGFWEARGSLRHIYTAALSRMSAPWGVLAHSTAHVLTMVRPNITLPPLIGGKGSLNWFATVAAKSGGGKGSSSSTAHDLLPQDVFRRNLGSGEGICQQFYKPGNKTTPPQINEAIMFEASEIDTMTALKDRSGQTTMAILRSGFSGETLGFSYRNNDHHIDAHEYRMTLVLSLQPARARPLMEDSGGGTPQRFQWFPGTDSRIVFDEPYWPGEMTWIPGYQNWIYPRELTIPPEARDLIKRERVKAMHGEQDALDGHALFVREKFAFGLALLDGRTDMTLEDWELAGIAAEVSARTRMWVAGELERINSDEAEQRGLAMGVTYAASDLARVTHTAKRTRAVSDLVLRRLKKGPMTNRELTHATYSRSRDWLPRALQSLQDDALIGRDQDGRWVLL